MSQIQDQSINQTIKSFFQNSKATGYELAQNSEIATIVKRDSTDFSTENRIIKHPRGREIVCELIDVALRPKVLMQYLKNQKSTLKPNPTQTYLIQSAKGSIIQISKQTTQIIYNAIEILTNQYQDFVHFIFQDNKENGNESINSSNSHKDRGQINKSNESEKKQKDNKLEDENWDDCVIMDGNFPQLTRNQQDQLLKKINSSVRLSQSDFFGCRVLQRMFMLFDQPAPLQETPVSYFNKIILQFVYQKPQQIMRFFYCDQSQKKQSCQKIRKLGYHLYNHSVIELLVHIMELQSDGNFFQTEKTQMLKALVQEVFHHQQTKKKDPKTFGEVADEFELEETSTMSDVMEERVNNYILFLKALYEKLEDRYEQEKFLQMFKYHLNDQKLLQRIISYFMFHFNYFDSSGLSILLIQMLKMDQANFRLHKASTQPTNPFGQNNFSFHNKNQQSSIALYDLKLSKQILDQIEKVLNSLSAKYEQWQGSTMRMIEYYELIHSWLNITIKERQQYAKSKILTPNFINECLFKIQSHQKSTILHNAIKNILVDFLPKINESMKIILAPECQLIEFIENYLSKPDEKSKQKRKCFENQLYHIGKTVMSMWEQQKMLYVMTKTQSDDQEDEKDRFTHLNPNEIDGDNIASNKFFIEEFERLKSILEKKQEFYEHLICGDPRKMGEYQEEQSSEIIMASSFKNFFKPAFNTQTTEPTEKKDRYGGNTQEQSSKPNLKSLKQQDTSRKDLNNNIKAQKKGRNLKLGTDEYTNNLFQSAISPLNANRSHTFNFDFDALPLDSDNSEEAVSQEEDAPQHDGYNEDEIKLMQENIQNFEVVVGNVLGVESNILSSSNSISNEKNMLNCDNYRRDELSKSMEISDMNLQDIQRVDSYLAIESPRKPSEDQILSLGLDSKQSGSRFSDDVLGSKIQNPISFIKEPNTIKIEQGAEETDTVDSNFVKHYSSYLKYDLDSLCDEVE